MGRTKNFSSAAPPDGPKLNKDGKRRTQDRLAPEAPDEKTHIRQFGVRGNTAQGAAVDPGPAAFKPNETRSTLIMKPGQVAGALQPKAPILKKTYGPAASQASRTVIMTPDNAELSEAKANIVVASEHPVSKNLQAPEIELVQHQIPTDVPPDPRLIMFAQPDGDQAAAFRVLRHHVLDAGHPQVIAVSGALDGCGKTTVAINLAMALAECGRAEVLLVDANLRNPKLASLLRFVPPWCFAEQLHTHREQPFSPWSFVEIKEIGLHVAAINPRSERSQRLDAPAFAIAMDRLRLGPYQHIVVDCPSVIGNADVNLIQDATDGVLLAARAKQVTARDIRNAVDQLTPTKILGTALFES